MKHPLSLYGLTASCAIASGAVSMSSASLAQAPHTPNPTKGSEMSKSSPATHPYVGMWVTQDGYIRHDLLPNGRYDEARGSRRSAYQGRYTMTGNHIDYVDDTGFTADGEFRDGVLYHAGMVLYREDRK